MLSKYLPMITVSIVAMSIAMAVFVTACGGTPVSKPVPAPNPATSPATPRPGAQAPAVDPLVLRAKGEEIFQKTAGGVGCKTCHGTDGKGIPNTAPDVRGKSADDIQRALGGDAMNFIRLTEDDLKAVATYLNYLSSQP